VTFDPARGYVAVHPEMPLSFLQLGE
jgi:hypothetical protein